MLTTQINENKRPYNENGRMQNDEQIKKKKEFKFGLLNETFLNTQLIECKRKQKRLQTMLNEIEILSN